MEKPRTKLVNFRVSEEEFEKIKELARDSGTRSTSEFARIQILKGFKQQSVLTTIETNQTKDSQTLQKILRILTKSDSVSI